MHHRKARTTKAHRASYKALALALAIATGLPAYAAAQQSDDIKSEAGVNFDIPSGDLSAALDRFSAQSGIQILYQQELVAGKRMSSVRGTLSPAAA